MTLERARQPGRLGASNSHHAPHVLGKHFARLVAGFRRQAE